MIRRRVVMVVWFATVAVVISACSGGGVVAGTPSASSGPASSAGKTVPHSGAPKVENPLSAKVLDGSPCDSALTPAQLTRFLGQTDPPEPSTDVLGTACGWNNAAGNGSGFSVAYQTKVDDGISLPYKTVKPAAARWVELAAVQGYPAIGYAPEGANPSDIRHCVVVVGISDQLAYSISGALSDNSAKQGKDACLLLRDVADAVMTNLKARA